MADQPPVVADNVPPSRASPETTGGALFDGGSGSASTTAVSAEVAELDPATLVAVTRTRNVDPASRATTT